MAKNVVNTKPRSFGNVKVFTADNDDTPISAMYKNLIWESKPHGRSECQLLNTDLWGSDLRPAIENIPMSMSMSLKLTQFTFEQRFFLLAFL